MVLLPKKHRTHYSRPKRCSQKVLQTRLLYTFPLKMYQYFKYSNSLLFPFDRCRRVASGLFISGVQAFSQNAKTHKIISINRFGIACCYFSSRNIPAIALFASTFLWNLVLSRSNQRFGCGLDQSHCRKLHIQLVVARTVNLIVDSTGFR